MQQTPILSSERTIPMLATSRCECWIMAKGSCYTKHPMRSPWPCAGTIKARSAGFEPATVGLEIRCSILLSYERKIGWIKVWAWRRWQGLIHSPKKPKPLRSGKRVYNKGIASFLQFFRVWNFCEATCLDAPNDTLQAGHSGDHGTNTQCWPCLSRCSPLQSPTPCYLRCLNGYRPS